MPVQVIEPIRELVSALIGYELGSKQFYTVVLSSLLSWLVVARIITSTLKSQRGIVAGFLALGFPLFIGLLAYGLAATQVVPKFDPSWAKPYLAYGMGAVFALLTIVTISKRLLSLSGFATIIVFLFASAAAFCAYFAVGVGLKTLEQGEQQIKQREERTKKEIDSVL